MNDWNDEDGWGEATEWDDAASQPGQQPPSSEQRDDHNHTGDRGTAAEGKRRKSEPAGSSSRPTRRAPKYYYEVEEEFPPPRRGLAFLLFLAILAAIAAAGLFSMRWYQHQIDPPGPPGDIVPVVIPNNTPTQRIGKILEANHIIENSDLFRIWVQVKGKGGFEAGQYVFRKNSSFEAVLGTLQEGPEVPDEEKLTIPEGYRNTQIAERVESRLPGRSATKFLAVLDAGQIRSAYQPDTVANLEGFLFPDTYTVALEDDEGVIAARMVETFDQTADEVGLSSAPQSVELTPYQVVIVASLVEREAKKDEDRPKIARVIYNRLKAEMRLQIDAGIIYALNNGTTRLFNEDYKYDSPYNTYIHKGLPPTPIANPGRASLDAALHPAEGDWLYYVVTEPDGTHSFAKTYKEHQRNIALAKENGVR